MNISDTCNAAADLIEVRGWRSGGGWKAALLGEGALCLEGALMAAVGDRRFPSASTCPSYAAVADYLNEESLWIWNDELKFSEDHPFFCTSPESHAWAAAKVIATLRAVAVIHAAREDATTAEHSDQRASAEAVSAS